MNYTNSVKIALSALKRNKFRAFLTMLGIIIGVASVIVMLAIGQGSKKSIQSQMSDMGTNLIFVMPGGEQKGGVRMGNSDAQNLKLTDLEFIEKNCPAISAISPEVRSSGQAVVGNENWPTTIYGVNNKYFNIRKYTIKSGRSFTEKEIQSYSKVCLVGKTIVENLFPDKDPIGQTIRFGNIPFLIIGVLSEKGENGMGQDQDDLIMSPYTTVQKRILAITHIQSIAASAVSEELNDAAITQITESLRTSHKLKEGEEDDFQVRSQAEIVQMFSSISDVMTALLGAISGISLLVGGIGIMNIMYVSVTERTREIGLRLSVGGRGNDILMQFLIESILLSAFGGIIGITLGILATQVTASVMNWPVVISSFSVIMSFLVCSAIGIFFGWYPARKAASLNPIDALRYE
ncbi:multidrug ABC transporter substrate-binding protein [Labilibaculum manganireducens]|uniref:Multidrug ABC transporter substrate-binding protein n=1 Tax=Labilibaculum manganireducens TaxID=1940525 RepID=A0A2N3HXB9_9BACT|nr:ABC transporter permease [Labilibaculum manganireducens]PKQ62681.1 multidrug ABC transporter substrate-binding protein [Labilibaculum manganireducens]